MADSTTEDMESFKASGTIRITHENKEEIVRKIEKDLLRAKNKVMAMLGAGRSVVNRKEQDILFLIMRGIDNSGEKVIKYKTMLTEEK